MHAVLQGAVGGERGGGTSSGVSPRSRQACRLFGAWKASADRQAARRTTASGTRRGGGSPACAAKCPSPRAHPAPHPDPDAHSITIAQHADTLHRGVHSVLL